MMEGPWCRFRKHEPASDIDTVVVDSLKALDLERPIREADIERRLRHVRFGSHKQTFRVLLAHLVGAQQNGHRNFEAKYLTFRNASQLDLRCPSARSRSPIYRVRQRVRHR
jgi:hypothetical protein